MVKADFLGHLLDATLRSFDVLSWTIIQKHILRLTVFSDLKSKTDIPALNTPTFYVELSCQSVLVKIKTCNLSDNICPLTND